MAVFALRVPVAYRRLVSVPNLYKSVCKGN